MRLFTSQLCALYRMRLGRRRRFLFVEQIANRAGNYWRPRMKWKYCPGCKCDLKLSAFGKRHGSKDGRERKCRDCVNAYNRGMRGERRRNGREGANCTQADVAKEFGFTRANAYLIEKKALRTLREKLAKAGITKETVFGG